VVELAVRNPVVEALELVEEVEVEGPEVVEAEEEELEEEDVVEVDTPVVIAPVVPVVGGSTKLNAMPWINGSPKAFTRSIETTISISSAPLQNYLVLRDDW
jgi:hypothetical protein